MDAQLRELLSHLLQADLLALVQRLIKSLPMKYLDAQDYFLTELPPRRLAQRIIKGLDIVVRCALFFGDDPLGDLAQVLESIVAMLAPGHYVVRTLSMNPVELDQKPDLRPFFHDKILGPDVVTNLVLLDQRF